MGCEQSKDSSNIIKMGRREAKCHNIVGLGDDTEHGTETLIKTTKKLTEDDVALIEGILSKHFFFYKLSKQQKMELIEQIEIFEAEAGKTLFKKGDPASKFFLIKSGSVRVKVDEKNSEEKVLERGEYFGELALLYKAPRSATL